MTAVAPLTLAPPVAVEDLRGPMDRFKCEPYSAIVLVRGCIGKRREQLDQAPRTRADYKPRAGSEAVSRRHLKMWELKCVECQVGAEIEERFCDAVKMLGATGIATLPPDERPRGRRRAIGSRPRPGSVPEPETEPEEDEQDPAREDDDDAEAQRLTPDRRSAVAAPELPPDALASDEVDDPEGDHGVLDEVHAEVIGGRGRTRKRNRSSDAEAASEPNLANEPGSRPGRRRDSEAASASSALPGLVPPPEGEKEKAMAPRSKCKACGQPGHNRRSCKTIAAGAPRRAPPQKPASKGRQGQPLSPDVRGQIEEGLLAGERATDIADRIGGISRFTVFRVKAQLKKAGSHTLTKRKAAAPAAPRPRLREGEDFLSLRLPAELTARVDALAAKLTKRALGVPVSQSACVRALIERGLAAAEKELRRG